MEASFDQKIMSPKGRFKRFLIAKLFRYQNQTQVGQEKKV